MESVSFLSASLTVALGGALGAWLRFVAGKLGGLSDFPFATLTVNILGSFVMGLLAGWLAQQDQGAEGWRLFLGVGVLGGFTTFSAFSLEIVQLSQRGAWADAALYVGASLIGGIVGLLAGLAVMRTA
jgi:fluoride exporter